MTAVIPSVKRCIDFVGLIDSVDCFLDFPETGEKALVREPTLGICQGKTHCSIETLFPVPPNSP
jgi:hypothetical protein